MTHLTNSLSIGFIGWNPFQFNHIKIFLKQLPNAKLLLEHKRQATNSMNEFLSGINDDRVICLDNPEDICAIEGQFEVLLCQTPFKNIHKIVNTPISMLQYGYAKEPHNYGAWRSFADLNLTYGGYAAARMAHFSPVAAVGNPNFDDWYDSAFHLTCAQMFHHILDSSKPTLLYAPTWGDLSSVREYIREIAALADEFNVMVKLHHNAVLLDKVKKQLVGEHSQVHFFGENDVLLQLMSVADVVVSDYSGAIFDAILCERPVALLNSSKSALNSVKMDAFSLEYHRRSELGWQVNEPKLLRATLKQALSHCIERVEAVSGLRDELFVTENGATQRAIDALKALAAGEYQPEQHQLYVRDEMRALYRERDSKFGVKIKRQLRRFWPK